MKLSSSQQRIARLKRNGRNESTPGRARKSTLRKGTKNGGAERELILPTGEVFHLGPISITRVA